MRRRHETLPLMAEINITPFTDVILVLLVIFIIATPLISQNNIEVKLPEAASNDTMDEANPAYITITGEGVVYFENKIFTAKELEERINFLAKKDPNMNVILAADQACRFQEVVRVIDLLKESGVTKFNINTKRVSE
ncbi:MAG: biopolymer transporter ExbD [Candidatus Omnitrophica bacterium]|nr:biopolymer transporter ExbD [Candidatus Omnitrophota bacterium]